MSDKELHLSILCNGKHRHGMTFKKQMLESLEYEITEENEDGDYSVIFSGKLINQKAEAVKKEISSKDSDLLTKIKELRQHCIEQCDANASLEKDTEKDLREAYNREPTYWEVKCEQSYIDGKYYAFGDISSELREIILEHKELDGESLKSTDEAIHHKLSKSAAWDLVREEIANAICLGGASIAQLDSHFYGEIEEDQ